MGALVKLRKNVNLDLKHVETAYRKLKRLVYYDKTDLVLRQRLADFECDASFRRNLLAVKKVLNSDDPLQERLFKRWLKEISFRVVPKNYENNGASLSSDSDKEGKFISNVTSAKTYHVSRVNYFFDGPIEIHLIAVLWIMFEGRVLDNQLGTECYGARLEESLSSIEDHSANLYRRYHELYARWRDTGIRKAKQLLTEDKTSVCILGIDVQEYYYHIQLDFQAISKYIRKIRRKANGPVVSRVISRNLFECLEAICMSYREKIEPLLKLTHKHISTHNAGIPIGLCSSPLLANWYLRDFDKAVKGHVRPAYYGRYVDDILIVIQDVDDPSEKGSPVINFMESVLVKSGILYEPVENRYELTNPSGLFLQQSKCILQYFNTDHSIAGLEKFQKKLEESGSDFLLMPVDEADNSLEEIAYELLYEGSVNKFRSVKGMAENRFELAKHLSRQSILHLLTDDPPDPIIISGLSKFFKGKNAIEFHDLWERVFTFYVIANDKKASLAFTNYLQSEINRVKHVAHTSITNLLIENLDKHLELSHCMSDALGIGSSDLQLHEDNHLTTQRNLRKSNLIRHHFVRIPLLNYTTYTGSLTTRKVSFNVNTDPRKLEFSPRYVNFDECLLLANSRAVKLSRKKAFQWGCSVFKDINRCDVEDMEWVSVLVKEDSDA